MKECTLFGHHKLICGHKPLIVLHACTCMAHVHVHVHVHVCTVDHDISFLRVRVQCLFSSLQLQDISLYGKPSIVQSESLYVWMTSH